MLLTMIVLLFKSHLITGAPKPALCEEPKKKEEERKKNQEEYQVGTLPVDAPKHEEKTTPWP